MNRKKVRHFTGAAVLASALSLSLLPAAQPYTASAESIITSSVPSAGTITITKRDNGSDHKPVSGAQYTAYKIMSLTPGTQPGDFASYSIESAYQEILGSLTPDNLNNYSAGAVETLIHELEQASAQNTGVVSAPTENGETKLTLDLGWYLIVETTVPAGTAAGASFLVSIPSTNNITSPGGPGTAWIYDLSAEPKSPIVTVDKNIINAKAAKDSTFVTNHLPYSGRHDTAGENDLVHYEIKAEVPEYDDSYFYNNSPKFEFADTMSSGLTILNDESYPVEIFAGDTKIPPSEGDQTNYTLKAEPSDTVDLSIVFTDDFLRNDAFRGKEICIRYYARLNENAVMGNEGNTNNVVMTYNNKPGFSTTASPVTSPEGQDVPDTYVYTYGIRVDKFDDEQTVLAGAKFQLYMDKELTEPLKDGNDQEVVHITDENGLLVFPRLDAGTYYLKETESPAGYSLLANPIMVKISPTVNADSGEVTGGDFTLEVNGNPITVTEGNHVTQLSVTEGLATVAVQNHRGFSLPATGGPGILALLIISLSGILTLSFFMVRPQKKQK